MVRLKNWSSEKLVWPYHILQLLLYIEIFRVYMFCFVGFRSKCFFQIRKGHNVTNMFAAGSATRLRRPGMGVRTDACVETSAWWGGLDPCALCCVDRNSYVNCEWTNRWCNEWILNTRAHICTCTHAHVHTCARAHIQYMHIPTQKHTHLHARTFARAVVHSIYVWKMGKH